MAPPKSTKSTKKASEAGTQRLDVEGDDARQKRLQSLLEHLSAPSTHPATTTPAFPAPPTGLPKFDFGDRRTEAVVPNTELLSRAQAFLPQLEASNRELLARAKADPKSVDIENVNDKEGRVIEMNLGLGVFEEKQKRNKPTAGNGKNAASSPLACSKAASSTKTGEVEDMGSSSSSSSSSSSQAEDEGPNDPLTNFFASLGSALDSATSPSLHSDSGSDSEDSDGEGEDGGPLMTFFDSLRYGQTISVDSSEEEGEGGGGSSSDSDEGGDGERRNEGREVKERREVKPLPKRARPRIEVVRDETPVEVNGEVGGA